MKYWALALLLVAAGIAYWSFPQKQQSGPSVPTEPAVQTAEKNVSENGVTPKEDLAIKPTEKNVSENPIMKVANFKLKIEYCTS